MNTEHVRSILNWVMKEKYPEIDTEIYISSEPNIESYLSGGKERIFNVSFDLSPEHYDMYIGDGIDKQKWDKIRMLIRDLLKMLSISDTVKFYYHRHEE